MCGITGIVGDFSPAEGKRLVQRMNQQIAHRGPDDESAWSCGGFAFGMRRLSIIDLVGGQQPIWSPKGSGIVFNGEIYNYQDLRSELKQQGVALKTR
ncbi:asparagine synthase (glutamine-hydrolyzing), partial [Magnetococcales bacterium HHB-1]